MACRVATLLPRPKRLQTCISWMPRICGNLRVSSHLISSTLMSSGIVCNMNFISVDNVKRVTIPISQIIWVVHLKKYECSPLGDGVAHGKEGNDGEEGNDRVNVLGCRAPLQLSLDGVHSEGSHQGAEDASQITDQEAAGNLEEEVPLLSSSSWPTTIHVASALRKKLRSHQHPFKKCSSKGIFYYNNTIYLSTELSSFYCK